MMLLPARYEGIDSRAEHYYADAIVSVGDFVLMGGDIAAMMLIESVARYIPGVVGKVESVEKESFTAIGASLMLSIVIKMLAELVSPKRSEIS